MNHNAILVAAFFLAAVSAPAQDLRGPRPVRDGATTRAFDDVRVKREAPQAEVRQEPRVERRVEPRSDNRNGRDGRDNRGNGEHRDDRDRRDGRTYREPREDDRFDRRGEHRRAESEHVHFGPVLRFPLPLPRGHWETVTETVMVEAGHWHEEHVPPVYGWVFDHCGRRYWGVIEAGYCRRVWCPPRYETRCRQVWVSC